MSLRVAKRLQADGIEARCVDIRWLNPLPIDDMIREAKATGRVLVVDECRETGGMAEGIMTALVEHCPQVSMKRVTGVDTYIPLGAAANLVLVSGIAPNSPQTLPKHFQNPPQILPNPAQPLSKPSQNSFQALPKRFKINK